MIKRVQGAGNQIVFENPEGPEGTAVYRRIVGALAWPRPPEPGALVVLGEDLSPEPALQARRLWVLAERQCAGLGELHIGCREFRHQWAADEWIADVSREQELRLWDRLNDMPKLPRTAQVLLSPATYGGEGARVSTIIGLISEQLRTGRKTLFFGEHTRLFDLMQGLLSNPREELDRAAERYPWLAALGYAVAEMILNQPLDPDIVSKHKTMADYPGPFARTGDRSLR
jgi:hypothetical protein